MKKLYAIIILLILIAFMPWVALAKWTPPQGVGYDGTGVPHIQITTITFSVDGSVMNSTAIITAVQDNLDIETSSRIAGDLALGLSTGTIASDLATETSNRIAGDQAIGQSTGTLRTDVDAKLPLTGGEVTGDLTVSSNTYITDSGRLGIGTTNPLSAIHLNSGVGSVATGISFGDGDAGIAEIVDDQIGFYVGNDVKMAVGVNFMWSPKATKTTLLYNQNTSGTVPVFIPRQASFGSGMGSNADGNVSLTASSVEMLRVSPTDATVYGNLGVGISPTELFQVGGGSLTVLSNGEVGIGTIAPEGTLHIKTAESGTAIGGVADDLVIESDENAGISIYTPDTNSSNIYMGSPSDNNGAIFRWSYNTSLFTIGTSNADGEVAIMADNYAEAIRIDKFLRVGIGITTPTGLFQVGGGTLTVLSSGKIGIGTLTPSSYLHIISTGTGEQLSLQRSGAGQSNGISFKDEVADNQAQIRLNGVSNNDLLLASAVNQDIRFYTGSDLAKSPSNERMVILNDGNVGIGIVTPSSKLDVAGYSLIGAGGNYDQIALISRLKSTGSTKEGTVILDSNSTAINSTLRFVGGDGTGNWGRGYYAKYNKGNNEFGLGYNAEGNLNNGSSVPADDDIITLESNGDVVFARNTKTVPAKCAISLHYPGAEAVGTTYGSIGGDNWVYCSTNSFTTNNTSTVTYTGAVEHEFLVIVPVTAEGQTGGLDLNIALFLNNQEIDNSEQDIETTASTNDGNCTIAYLVTMNQNDTLDLRAKDDAGLNVEFEHISYIVKQND